MNGLETKLLWLLLLEFIFSKHVVWVEIPRIWLFLLHGHASSHTHLSVSLPLPLIPPSLMCTHTHRCTQRHIHAHSASGSHFCVSAGHVQVRSLRDPWPQQPHRLWAAPTFPGALVTRPHPPGHGNKHALPQGRRHGSPPASVTRKPVLLFVMFSFCRNRALRWRGPTPFTHRSEPRQRPA